MGTFHCWLFGALVISAVACGSDDGPPSTGSVPGTGLWDTRAPLGTPRQEMPSAMIDGRIYTPGGYDAQGATVAVLEIYDVAVDRWSVGPAMPDGRNHPGVSTLGSGVYVTGGYTGAGPASPSVFAFDPMARTWATRRPMIAARAAHVTVEYAGKLYAIGGVRGGTVVGTTEVYDPLSDAWTSLTPMPTPREHLSAAAIGDRIYVVGGRNPGNVNTLEAYSPSTNTWERLTDMPTARGGLAAAAYNGKLYVFGGENPGVFPHTEEYDPVSNTWRRVADMPTPRHGMGAVTVGDAIYVIGGGVVAGFGASPANERFTPPR